MINIAYVFGTSNTGHSQKNGVLYYASQNGGDYTRFGLESVPHFFMPTIAKPLPPKH